MHCVVDHPKERRSIIDMEAAKCLILSFKALNAMMSIARCSHFWSYRAVSINPISPRETDTPICAITKRIPFMHESVSMQTVSSVRRAAAKCVVRVQASCGTCTAACMRRSSCFGRLHVRLRFMLYLVRVVNLVEILQNSYTRYIGVFRRSPACRVKQIH